MEENVQKLRTGHEWPDDKPFPLSPDEAYWVMRGWRVLPKSAPGVEVYRKMPGRGLEFIKGHISLKA